MQKLILRHDIRANDLLISNSNRLYPHRSNLTLSLQYQYKGSTVTGKLAKRAPNGSDAKPIWIVIPSDRRRKNEEIPEKALGKVIDAQEATTNRGPKLKKTDIVALGSSPSSRNSNCNNQRIANYHRNVKCLHWKYYSINWKWNSCNNECLVIIEYCGCYN